MNIKGDDMIKKKRLLSKIFAILLCVSIPFIGYTDTGNKKEELLIQTTTSVYFTGIITDLAKSYQKKTNTLVKIISSGTGQALRNAQNGDADLVLVHSPTLEEDFVQKGFGTQRYPLMYNYFVIIGHKDDPAYIANSPNITKVFQNIYDYGTQEKTLFISRGDNSGTHFLETSLWKDIGYNPELFQPSWYREVGQGMGQTINIAVASGAYSLSDKASWLKFSNKASHKILYQNDKKLYNLYSIIPVNKEKHPHVNYAKAMEFIDWVFSDEAQSIIQNYHFDGEKLYYLLQ